MGTPGGQHEKHTHACRKRSQGGEEESGGGTERKETSLDTFHTFHLLLVVGGVALRRPLWSAERRTTRVVIPEGGGEGTV